MGWSTRELAELTGTTLRAVRHYHEVGLLAEPERRSNGYKQYGVAHLVRVLRIKRLTDLGFGLSQIAEMGDADDHPEEALRTLDAELATTIERLQRARIELGLILTQAAPTDLPPELAAVAKNTKLSDADRSFSVVMSRVLGSKGLEAYAELIQDVPDDPSFQEFDDLPDDVDEAARQDLAERMAGPSRAIRAAHPAPDDAADGPLGAKRAGETIGAAMRELYNGAQLDVLVRMEAEIKKLDQAK
jgi:DNA-binding transcriptional MerR regulator